jgi:hypothetical protein
VSVTPPSSPQPPKKRVSRWPLWTGLGFAALLLILMLALAALYLSRRSLGREVAVGWLRDRGVEAQIDVERLDLDGFTGTLRIGPAKDPEVVVDRVEVRYQVMGFWNGRPLGVEVVEVRLVRPVARGEWRGGTLRMGQLDKVIDEFRRRPPRPDARQPIVRVEQGRFVLATDYGRADIRGDARLEDGKLMGLDATLQPTALKVGDLSAALGDGRVTARTAADRVVLTARFGLQTLTLGETHGEIVHLDLAGEVPYPDLKARRGDGRVVLTAKASAERFATPGLSARAAAFEGGFDGLAKGWIDTLSVSGQARTRLTAASARTADLTLADLVAEGQGPASFDAKTGPRLALAAGVRAQGGWAGLGPVLRTDDATMRAVKRLAARFDLSAPGVNLALDRDLSVRLARPARIAGAGGAVATVSPLAGAPLLANGRGALRLALRGGGLPTVEAVVPRYVLTADGARAELSGTAAGSLGPLMGATLTTRGRLTLGGDAVSYTAAACTPVTLERLELGVNDVERLAGSLCPLANAPLLTLRDGAWRVRARAEGLSAAAPFLEARVADGAGTMDLAGKGEAFQADMTIASARVIDTATPARFNPVVLSGAVASRGGDWTGDLAAADPAGRPLGRAALSHQGLAGRGGVVFDTGVLTFAEGGLQPSALTPLATMIGEPATGRARFEGRLDWTEATVNGAGTLTLDEVGFKTPLGAMSGLAGRVVFTSLIPLVTAPGQTLTATKVDAIASLTDVRTVFQLDGPALKLATASLQVGGGTLRLDPVTVQLDGTAWEGRLNVDGVQLSELVEASPFADRVDLDARVSGVLPFTVTPQRVSVIEGKLAAIQPGRISIRREALTTISARGGEATVTDAPAIVPTAPAASAGAVTEFAYQAMEHLAFEHLDVTLNSLPGGRLGALFHINGRFDPPKRQELRLGLVDLITRRFLQRTLPLPSGTAVNLTLDSSLNIDELLRDMAAAGAAGSPTVQP